MAGPSTTVEQLLASTQLSSDVDVQQLLSEDYDSSADDGGLSSMEESGAAAILEPLSEDAAEEPSSVRALGGQLQSALAQRNVELAELERQYRKERRRDRESIQQLRGDNEALRRAAAAAQARTASEMRTYRSSVEAVHARSRTELDELRAQLQELHAEVPALRERLAATKADFAQLVIDEPLYELLRRKRDDELSVVEHVQMRIKDLVAATERRVATTLAVAPPTTVGPSLPAAATAGTYQTSQLQWQAETAARDALSARLNEANARADQKHAEAEEARAECRQLRQQAALAASTPEGQAQAQAEAAERRVEEVRAQLVEARGELQTTRAAQEKVARQLEEAETSKNYLAQDKEYLRVQVRARDHIAAESGAQRPLEHSGVRGRSARPRGRPRSHLLAPLSRPLTSVPLARAAPLPPEGAPCPCGAGCFARGALRDGGAARGQEGRDSRGAQGRDRQTEAGTAHFGARRGRGVLVAPRRRARAVAGACDVGAARAPGGTSDGGCHAPRRALAGAR